MFSESIVGVRRWGHLYCNYVTRPMVNVRISGAGKSKRVNVTFWIKVGTIGLPFLARFYSTRQVVKRGKA
jgi:hypothetical protein